jgi:tetratricopeptide (TPR) repeat protein
MPRIVFIIVTLAFSIVLASGGNILAADPDNLIKQLSSSPKKDWDRMLTVNRSDINEGFINKLLDKAQTAYQRKDYDGSWLLMEIADRAEFVSSGSRSYTAIYQFYLGRMFLRDNEIAWALRVADGIKKTNPSSEKGYLLKAKAHLARKETDLAIPELMTTVEKAPDSEDGHLSLGYAYLLKDDTPSALKQFQEVVRINPGNVYARDAVASLTGQSAQTWKSDNEEDRKSVV